MEDPKARQTAQELPGLQIHQELQARIAERMTAPCRIRHSAYLIPNEDETLRSEVRNRFEEIIKGLNIPPKQIYWGERNGRVETALTDTTSLRVVWELHTEFYSYTTYHLGAPGDKNEHTLVPSFTFPAMPSLGSKLVDLDIVVLPGEGLTPELEEFLGATPYYGGNVVQGAGQVWTNFRVDEWGQGRYVVRAGTLTSGRLGRLIRRLVEIENYYHLIMIPLDEYREQVKHLRTMEKQITVRSESIAADLASRDSDAEKEHLWLVYLTRDLAELIRLTERMRYKLSAADSYYAIVEERMRWLREVTGAGYQSMDEFLSGRIAPTIRNYRNFISRADVLESQLTSLSNMMRTRVNLNMERQSLRTLQAMDRREELQLILQRTVEGLSLIVLGYYLTGLANYIFKSLHGLGWLAGKPEYWTAASIPVWLGLAFGFTRRVKRLVHSYLENVDQDDSVKTLKRKGSK